MKKTLSITLGGRAYVIEEDAYKVLERYVDKIRAQFKDDPNVDELVADMEAGMADVFEKQMGKRKDAALTLLDVEAMIAVMGAPEEIAEEEPVAPDGTAKDAPRDDRSDATGPKRLYRNPDDVVIAGVCSGLAAYLGVDVVIVRILFLILAFVNGFGILAYIIFWIAMPEATTSAQKLEMRGKPVNLQEIEELVKEKAEKVSAEGKKAWERMQDAKSPARRFLELPVRFIGACARVVVTVASGIIKVLGGVLGVALIIVSVLAMAAATVMGIMMLFGIQSPYVQSDLPLYELLAEPRYYIGMVAAYIVIIIPLAFLIRIGNILVTRRNTFRTAGVVVMSIVWFAALSTTAAMGAHLVPWAQERFATHQATQSVEQVRALTTAEAAATSLVFAGDVRVTFQQNATPSLMLVGREEDLATVQVTEEEGVLRIEGRRLQQDRKICLFCSHKRIEVALALPDVSHIEAQDDTRVQLTYVNDALTLATMHHAVVEGDVDVLRLDLSQRDESRVALAGTVGSLYATMEDIARLAANDLHATDAEIAVIDRVYATLRVDGALTATAQDWSRIIYYGNPATTTIQELDLGRVRGAFETDTR